MAWPRTRDDLTRLLTRAAFTHDLHRHAAAGLVSVLLCDLDHLKLLNDSLGHPAGDERLRMLGQALRTEAPAGARAYRLGGDEFALLSSLEVGALGEWAQGFLQRLGQHPQRPISLSMGIAPLGTPGHDPDEAVAWADRRLYAAKRSGRGRVVSDDLALPFGEFTHRLLERDEPRIRATRWLQRALGEPGELVVQSEPGAGLSAFLLELEVVARNLGYRTLLLSGDPVRRCRQDGVWYGARLDGQLVDSDHALSADSLAARLTGPGLTGPGFIGPGFAGTDSPESGHKPLAVLLDTPERFDPDTSARLRGLLGGAQAVVRGQTDERRAGQSAPLLNLAPLSVSAVQHLGHLLGEKLDQGAAEWLFQRTGGLPAPLLRWLSALRLEAGLRRLSTAQLTAQGSGDWEEAVARHLQGHLLGTLSWPRPTLYGRHAELQAAAAQLRRTPLLTITGPSGRGKTRFAEQLLGELEGSFSGGAYLVSLDGVGDQGAALALIAQTLIGQPLIGPPLIGPPGKGRGAASVGRLLARRPTLLVLDAAAERLGEFPLGALVLETLCAHSALTRLIVVAPQALGAHGESVLALAPLSGEVVRSALAGAPRRASAAQTDDHTRPNELAIGERIVGELVGWIAGEPLRLSAALALLDQGDPESGHPARYDPALHDPAQSGMAPGDPDRQGSLARAVRRLTHSQAPELSALWHLLGTDERRRLAALSRLSGPFTLSWAAQVSGASAFVLRALRDHGYLRAQGSGLYTLPGALARHAEAELARSPSLTARVGKRALDLLQLVCAQEVPRSAAWFSHLDHHYPSLRSTLAGQMRTGTVSPGWAEVLLTLAPYRISRGYLHECRADLEAALDRAAAEPRLDAALRRRLALTHAEVLQHLGDYGAEESLFTGLPDSSELWPAAALIAARSLHRRSLYSQSRSLYSAVGRHPARSASQAIAALDGQARSSIYLGNLEEAWTLISAARQQAQALNDPLLNAAVLNTAALIATEQRALGTAGELFGEALEIHRTFGDRSGAILNLTGLAWATLLGGDAARSAELSRQVLRRAQDAGNIWELANALTNLGHALSLLRDTAQARATYLEGVRLAAVNDAPSLVAEALAGLAGLRADTEPGPAHTLLRLALEHPGANAECRHYFAPLAERLAEQRPAALVAEDRALIEELRLLTGRLPVGEGR